MNTSSSSQPIILLVEDDSCDIEQIQGMFRKLELPVTLVVAQTGEEALIWLAGAPGAGPLPSLVLLDLGLPVISGLEVLDWIRGPAGLASLPVVVFSSSSNSQDIQDASDAGANGYFLKTASQATLEQLVNFWWEHWLLRTGTIGMENLNLLRCRESLEAV